MNKCINTINYEKGQMNGVMGGGITLFHPFDPPGPVIPPGSAVTTLLTMDYCGNHIYRNGVLERTMNDYGYQADNTYYYYIKDYHGNVRAVIDQNGNLREINNYYPYGGLMGAASAGAQPNKYGSKELDRQNGIDWYDSQARFYDPLIGRTPTMDPLTEKYYSISPYVWCADNPIVCVDSNGADINVIGDVESFLTSINAASNVKYSNYGTRILPTKGNNLNMADILILNVAFNKNYNINIYAGDYPEVIGGAFMGSSFCLNEGRIQVNAKQVLNLNALKVIEDYYLKSATILKKAIRG